MTLDLHKCSVMYISNKQNIFGTKHNKFQLNCIHGLKYRGVPISFKMSCIDHIKAISTKSKNTISSYLQGIISLSPIGMTFSGYTHLHNHGMSYLMSMLVVCWIQRRKCWTSSRLASYKELIPKKPRQCYTYGHYTWLSIGSYGNTVDPEIWILFHKTINDIAMFLCIIISIYITAQHVNQLQSQTSTKLNCYKYSFLPATSLPGILWLLLDACQSPCYKYSFLPATSLPGILWLLLDVCQSPCYKYSFLPATSLPGILWLLLDACQSPCYKYSFLPATSLPGILWLLLDVCQSPCYKYSFLPATSLPVILWLLLDVCQSPCYKYSFLPATSLPGILWLLLDVCQ